MKRVTYTLLLASLIFIASAAIYTADAQTTVHALLVIMDDDHLAPENEDGIGPSYAVDQYYIESLLKRLQTTTKSSVQIKTLLSSEGTATFLQIQQWLNEVNPTSEDMVLIYYSGHGGMNNWKEKRTFLGTLGTYTYRDDLINLMKISTVGARLQMLITDCCSNTTEPPPIQIEKTSSMLTDDQVLEHLFLQHAGFLDITGATEGQYSWGVNPDPKHVRSEWQEKGYGGTFTHSLITAFELEDYEAAINDYTKANLIEPDNVMHLRQAIMGLIELKQYETIIDYCTKAIHLTDIDSILYSDFHKYRAYAKLQLEQYKGAIDDYTVVIRLTPDAYLLYMQRGEAYENLNRYQKAKVDYQTALKLVKGTGNTGFEKILEDALKRLK